MFSEDSLFDMELFDGGGGGGCGFSLGKLIFWGLLIYGILWEIYK